jgi:hypothetical protein
LTNNFWCFYHTFSEVCTKFDVHSLSDPSLNHVRPDIRLQIKGLKNKDVYPAAQNFEHWLKRYASSIITVASCYYNCCTDGSTSPRNYGYHPIRAGLDIGLSSTPWRTNKTCSC